MRQQISELGPDGDFAPYVSADRIAFLLCAHSGGRLFVSQFDGGEGAGLEGVEAFAVEPLRREPELPRRPIGTQLGTRNEVTAYWTAPHQ